MSDYYKTTFRAALLASSLFLMSSVGGLSAADLQWVGDTDANLGTAANWSPAQTPVAGDLLIFDSVGTAGGNLNNNLSGVALDSLILLSNDLAAWSFAGNAIEYTNSIICSNLNGVVIDNDLTLGTDRVDLDVDDDGYVDVNGVVGDGGLGRAFRVRGGGLVTLYESNTFGGGLQLWGGYLRMDSGAENLGLGTNIIVGGNSVSDFVNYIGDNNFAIPTNVIDNYQFTIEEGAQLNVRALQNANFDAKLTGPGQVRYGTSGALGEGGYIDFSRTDNDYTGDYLQGFGTLRYTSVADPGQPSSLGAGTNIIVRNSLSASRMRYRGTNASSTTRRIIWDPKTGAFALDNDNVGGPLASLKFLSTESLRVPEDPLAGNAELRLRGPNIGRNELAQSINDAYDTNGTLVGTTEVRKMETGTWIVSGHNTNTGSFRVSDGTLVFGRPESLPSVGQVVLDNQTAAGDESNIGVIVGGSGWSEGEVSTLISGLTVQANSSSALAFDTFNGDFTYGSAITKGMGVHKIGPNTLTLSGANTYNGSTRIKQGTLLVNGSTAAAVAGRQVDGASMIVYYTSAYPFSERGTLGGSGTVGGVTWIRRGGVIQGGDANFSGTLTLVDGLILGNNSEDDWSRLRFNIAGGGNIATTSFNVTGTNHLVQILDPVLTIGTNTLITYTGGSIGGSNGFGGLSLDTLPAGVTANLLDTGSEVQLAVTSVPVVESPVLGYTPIGGGVIELSWTNTGSFKLQSQTNALSVGLSTNWVDYPDTSNPVNVTNDPANPTEFFRLISTP